MEVVREDDKAGFSGVFRRGCAEPEKPDKPQ
jgi:hypothetical protein